MKNNNFTFLLFCFLLLGAAVLPITGCSSIAKKWKSMISPEQPQQEVSRRNSSGATYSQQNNLAPSAYRKYKRVKRKDLEDDAHLEGKSGSLWVMEGQGAYLFSQNTVRLIGDPIAVRIEGDPAEQLSAKAKVISNLLAQIKERRRRALARGPAGDGKKDDSKKSDPAAVDGVKDAGAAQNQTPVTAANASAPNEADEKKEFNVKTVPTRIIDRTVDGNYRVRGVQPFLIDDREYKVIVTGIIRAEDFSDGGLSASQLLDANFDIVSGKNTEMR